METADFEREMAWLSNSYVQPTTTRQQREELDATRDRLLQAQIEAIFTGEITLTGEESECESCGKFVSRSQAEEVAHEIEARFPILEVGVNSIKNKRGDRLYSCEVNLPLYTAELIGNRAASELGIIPQ